MEYVPATAPHRTTATAVAATDARGRAPGRAVAARATAAASRTAADEHRRLGAGSGQHGVDLDTTTRRKKTAPGAMKNANGSSLGNSARCEVLHASTAPKARPATTDSSRANRARAKASATSGSITTR
jgi:hypothetical protein